MSIREGVAEIARCGDWCVVERCKKYKDDCGLCVADQILTYLEAEVEKMEGSLLTPEEINDCYNKAHEQWVNDGKTELYQFNFLWQYIAYETTKTQRAKAIQDILKLLEE